MVIYLDLIIILNLLVDFMLLLGTNRLSGFPSGTGRCAAASLWGGVYGGACLLPGFRFLGGLFWRIVFLTLMGVCAFGMKVSAFRRTSLFVILSMAMGGIALNMNRGNFAGIVGASVVVWLLCRCSFREIIGSRQYVPLTLVQGDKSISLTALRDTGNCLRDPVSGDPVYLIGPEAAAMLTGLTLSELKDPYGTIMRKPIQGLKLIPFKAVGSNMGILLGLRLDRVCVGTQCKRAVVAFAPEGLGNGGEYQALVGS